ncbi:MAG: hypothetical protein GX434_13625 [Peptococcaceae bacterium]|nr:hypothetical protein [Peptococcaceae bacterium]
MKQSSKDKYLSQKGKTSSKGKRGSSSVQQKKPLAPFEKLVLFLLFIFLIAAPLAFFVNKSIMIYVGLVNYFILGAAITVRPDYVVEVMRKNNKRFEELYGQRVDRLLITIRVFGIIFVAMGAAFFYFLT